MSSFRTMIHAALLPYVETLGIRRPLKVQVRNEAEEALGIASDEKARAHVLLVLPAVAADYRVFMPGLVKAVCRASLAETHHAVFTSAPINLENVSSVGQDQFALFHAVVTRVLGIWANDIRHHHWPKLSSADLRFQVERICAMDPARQQSVFRRTNGFMEIAELYAMSSRHLGGATGMNPLLELMPSDRRQLLDFVAEVLIQQPPLAPDLATALVQLERAVGETLDLLPCTIQAKLRREPKHSWQFSNQ